MLGPSLRMKNVVVVEEKMRVPTWRLSEPSLMFKWLFHILIFATNISG